MYRPSNKSNIKHYITYEILAQYATVTKFYYKETSHQSNLYEIHQHLPAEIYKTFADNKIVLI